MTSLRLLVLLVLMLSGAARAQTISGGGFSGATLGRTVISAGSLDARFTAYPIQGSTCVAPCAFYFDAIGRGYLHPTKETTDSVFTTREMHVLHCGWNFDDPTAGTWALTGHSRNTATGCLAGHTYYTPGTYDPVLTVVNPNANGDTATTTLTVVDPLAHFPASERYCFADNTTNGTNWTGCPLDCAGADSARCVNATGASGGSSSFNTTCNGDAAARWCLYRRGDTYGWNTELNPSDGATPGMVSAFGSGADPVFDMNGQQVVAGERWTIYGIDFTETAQFLGTPNPGAGPTGADRISYIDVDAQVSTCIEEWMDSSYDTDDVGVLHAYINFSCTITNSGSIYSTWPGSRYTLWQGGTFDRNNLQGTPTNIASVRSHHMQNWVTQHSRWIRSPNDSGGTDWHMRTWDEWPGNYGAPGTPPSDEDQALRLNLFSYNRFEGSRTGATYFQVCADSNCGCIGAGSGPGACAFQQGVGLTVRVEDIIWENNFFSYENEGGTVGGGAVISATGGDLTARNNVVDMQNSATGGRGFFAARGHDTNHIGGGVSSGTGISVHNNTTYVGGSSYSSAYEACKDDFIASSTGCLGGCYCRSNLLVHTGGYSGDTNIAAGSFAASAAGNLVTSANPFVGTPGGVATTAIGDFALAGSASHVINQGYDFSPGTDTDRWVHDDAAGLCRDDGQWDIGAYEFGASAVCQ